MGRGSRRLLLFCPVLPEPPRQSTAPADRAHPALHGLTLPAGSHHEYLVAAAQDGSSVRDETAGSANDQGQRDAGGQP